jgi:hypothetical protein
MHTDFLMRGFSIASFYERQTRLKCNNNNMATVYEAIYTFKRQRFSKESACNLDVQFGKVNL